MDTQHFQKKINLNFFNKIDVLKIIGELKILFCNKKHTKEYNKLFRILHLLFYSL